MTSIPFPLARSDVCVGAEALTLDRLTFGRLFTAFGPSLGLWRGAEVAALRACAFAPPIVDLGCGDGLVTSLVLPTVDVGIYRRIEACAVEETALPDASVRTIVSNSVLEHIGDIDAALAAVARLLAPGGRLLFTVPTEAFGAWLLVPLSRYGAWRNDTYGHRNVWPASEWTRRLRRAGMEVEAVRPYLRRTLVALWDALELAQRVWLWRWRVAGLLWRRLPPSALGSLARAAERVDLSSPSPGGGRLIVARRL